LTVRWTLAHREHVLAIVEEDDALVGVSKGQAQKLDDYFRRLYPSVMLLSGEAGEQEARDDATVITNIFTGRPARGLVNRLIREVGPLSDAAPAFPAASGAVAPLRARAEAAGSGDFSPLWAGQAAALARAMPAGELTRRLAKEAAASG
jgi:hypothetical protein